MRRGEWEKEETVQRNFKERKSAGKSSKRKRKKTSGLRKNGKTCCHVAAMMASPFHLS